MQESNERIQEFKEILEKKKGEKVSWAEAEEGSRNLTQFAELMYKLAESQWHKDEKLKKHPKGFHLEGEGYSCVICGDSISNDETWYDKYGLKCLVCQKAINKKIVPAMVAKNKDSWYSAYDMQSRLNMDRHVLNRFVKKGILVSRTIPNASGKPHVRIFLIKDNKDTLPPKKITESQMVKEIKDGKDWYHSEPWYRFVDPQIALKDYKIIEYLVIEEDSQKHTK